VTALVELSAALDVRVTGVQRRWIHVNGRHQQHANGWALTVPDAPIPGDTWCSSDGRLTYPCGRRDCGGPMS
jgi:hypothetical protein